MSLLFRLDQLEPVPERIKDIDAVAARHLVVEPFHACTTKPGDHDAKTMDE
jgi:hypothetical protein